MRFGSRCQARVKSQGQEFFLGYHSTDVITRKKSTTGRKRMTSRKSNDGKNYKYQGSKIVVTKWRCSKFKDFCGRLLRRSKKTKKESQCSSPTILLSRSATHGVRPTMQHQKIRKKGSLGHVVQATVKVHM